jgi:hypothetical protein
VDVETGWGRLDAAAALCAVAPEIAIAHDERLAFTRPTGILAPLTVGADSFGTFDRGAWWTNRLAELVEAVVVIALPDSFGDSVRVWPHVWGTTTLRDGFHLAHFSPWAELAGREGRVVRLHGWLYRLPGAAAAARAAGAGWAIAKPTRGAGPDESDADDAWLPLPPDQARIAFTVIGPRRGPVPHIPDKSLEIPSSDPVIHAVPNPVRDHCVVSGPPGSRMVIVDLTGRAIRRTTLDPVRGRFDWDGRDAIGKRVPPGLYFLMAEGAPRNARSRISPLRLVVLD